MAKHKSTQNRVTSENCVNFGDARTFRWKDIIYSDDIQL